MHLAQVRCVRMALVCSSTLRMGVCQANFLWSNKLLLPFVLFELCTDVEGVYKHYYMQYQYVIQYWYIDVENVECAEEGMVCVEGVVLHVDDVAVRMCSMCNMGGSMWGTGGLM